MDDLSARGGLAGEGLWGALAQPLDYPPRRDGAELAAEDGERDRERGEVEDGPDAERERGEAGDVDRLAGELDEAVGQQRDAQPRASRGGRDDPRAALRSH